MAVAAVGAEGQSRLAPPRPDPILITGGAVVIGLVSGCSVASLAATLFSSRSLRHRRYDETEEWVCITMRHRTENSPAV